MLNDIFNKTSAGALTSIVIFHLQSQFLTQPFLMNIFLFPFSSSQEAIAYFPLVILISGAFASVVVKKISKSLGTKVN